MKVSPFRWDPRTSKTHQDDYDMKTYQNNLMVTVTGWLGFWISILCVFFGVFVHVIIHILVETGEICPPKKRPAAKHCFLSLFNYTVFLAAASLKVSDIAGLHNKKRVWPPLFAPVVGLG